MLAEQFKLDRQQQRRVRHFAEFLFNQAEGWEFDDPLYLNLLRWASELHEIGISIAYGQHHKHGAYIIENSDIDGFSRQLQYILSLLVRSHRQKIPKMLFLALPAQWPEYCERLVILLRLSVAFHRGRTEVDETNIALKVKDKHMVLMLDKKWAAEHPLTLFDLKTEQSYLEDMSYQLKIEMC